jgi:hypothetical protein
VPPLVTVIHAALLVAVQEHPTPAATLTVPDDATELVKFVEAGEIDSCRE